MRSTKRIDRAPGKRAETRDFYAWLCHQAIALRKLEGKVPTLDCADLAEELEGMARSDERATESLLENLLVHLLKWRYQSKRRSRSWRASILNARSDLRYLLDESPSLKSKNPAIIDRAYEKARHTAGAEMDYDEHEWEDAAPRDCPWKLDLLLGDFWPDAD